MSKHHYLPHIRAVRQSVTCIVPFPLLATFELPAWFPPPASGEVSEQYRPNVLGVEDLANISFTPRCSCSCLDQSSSHQGLCGMNCTLVDNEGQCRHSAETKGCQQVYI
ncbi:hypothetical protein BU25DRAFT_34110 [Macroventuria anomochaeta]|uniref:Uncharacterized protein n=1 Tax=Macroventuria anomochaeta TaxID=301207 RepID=A0ACB6S334_9PLEO|nr:uncharacterized protein BU25DRAFT_34110 [Macroventuria anomochaeta]KAF2628363.1 hypothetical protein BU25DRAFT_34110 [Macroventuria anomochaeta]